MTSLKTLKFTEAPAQLKADPKEQRRQKLVAQLEQQKHMVIDPAYSIIQAKWTKDETGNRVKTETPKRLRRWWHKVGQDAHAERSVEGRTWKVVWSPRYCKVFPDGALAWVDVAGPLIS